MRWERVKVNTTERDTPEGKTSPGRIGGSLGPGKRWGHACNSIGGRFLYVFGGYGKDNCQTNDVHVFDTASNTWIRPNVSGLGPAAREGHCATLVDNRIFIFGGCGKPSDDAEDQYYNDLYILNTDNFLWQRPVTYGTPPSARDSHTCSSWKNKVIVIGGEDSSDYYLSDVHMLDADTLVWTELQTTGQMLTSRAGHSTVALGKHLLVFGGFTGDRNLYDDLHVLNVETGVWSKVENAGGGPSARFSVAGDCLDLIKGVLVFMSGCNQSLDALDDMYYLYTEMSVQNEQDELRQEKCSLRKELKKKCQEQNLLPTNRCEDHMDFLKLEMMANTCQLVTLPNHDQEGTQIPQLCDFSPSREKQFQAKVTGSFQYGYTIETNIDGNPLRGVLFACNPSFSQSAHALFSRHE